MNVPPPEQNRPAGGQQPPPRSAPHGEADGHRYGLAPWHHRVMARGVDLAAVGVPALLLALVVSLAWVGTQMVFGGSTLRLDERFPVLLVVVFFLLYTGYEVAALYRSQQTYGRARMGLRLAPAAGAGRLGPLRLAAVMVRSALPVLPVLFLVMPVWVWLLCLTAVVFLCGAVAAWDRPNRQGLHDKIAGTVVLDVSAPVRPA